MTVLFRALKILRTAIHYRLDELLPKRLPWFWRCLFRINRIHIHEQRQSRGRRLRLAFEELGPIFIKFGQLLSTRPDLLPADIVRELSYLQDRVAPFDSQHFHKIVADSLDQPERYSL